MLCGQLSGERRDGEDSAVCNLGSTVDDVADKDGAQALLRLANQGADHAAAPAAKQRVRKSGPDAHEAAKRGISATSPAHLTA